MLCAIPLEIANRELDGNLYLALQLAKKGLPTLIGERMVNEYVFRINKGKPVIYFDQDQTVKANMKVLEAGGAVINMTSEGIVFDGWPTLPLFANVADSVTEMCVWGESQLETIGKTLPEGRRDILSLTGTPLFDLLSERFLPYYRKQSIIDEHGEDYILINTNFNMFNMKMDLDKYLKMLGKMDEWKMYNQPEVRAIVDKERKYQGGVVKTFLELVKVLASEFPDRHIILRPHPTENLKLYEDSFKGLDNVFVTNDGSVRHWIASAGAVIHHDCTTGTEAMLMGKLVISFRKQYDENVALKLLADVGLDLRTPEDVVQAVRNGEMPEDVYQEQVDKLKPFFANLDKDAAEAVASIAEKYADQSKVWLPEPLGLVETVKCWRKYFSKLLRACQPGHNGKKVRFALSKFPRHPFSEFQDRIKRMQAVDPELPEVDVTSLALNTILITPR